MASGNNDTLHASSVLAKLMAIKACTPTFPSAYDPSAGTYSLDAVASQSAQSKIWWEGENTHSDPYVKRYTISESTEDLLALSTAWYRLRKNKELAVQPMITTLTDPNLYKSITEEDRVFADTIRDFYRKKFIILALKEIKLSSYREDLRKFVHSDGKLFTEKVLPLVFRLPEFYEYDTAFADMVRGLAQHDPDRFQRTAAHNLRPLKMFRVKRSTEYWFQDENDCAVVIVLENANPCKSLFEREYKKESMNMVTTGVVSPRDGFNFFRVGKWDVE